MKQLNLFPAEKEKLPTHKREFIDWLEQFQFTGALVEFVRKCKLGPREIERLKRPLVGTLKPKASL